MKSYMSIPLWAFVSYSVVDFPFMSESVEDFETGILIFNVCNFAKGEFDI